MKEQINPIIEKNIKKYEGMIEGVDFVKCAYCEMRSTDMTRHVKAAHGIEGKEYAKTHQLRSESYTTASSERFKGSKNPAYQHGGKFSPFSKNFVKQDHDRMESIQKAIQNRSYNTRMDYWLKRADGDQEEAQRLLTERQKTFSLEKCIERYGEERGRQVWNRRQVKWLRNAKRLKKFSVVSQKLFMEIMETFQSPSVYFATWDTPDMKEHECKEYRLILSNGRIVLPDFIDLSSKKIIEFDGDYWHYAAETNQTRDAERQMMIEADGYKVLRIREKDYKKDPRAIVETCLNFLME